MSKIFDCGVCLINLHARIYQHENTDNYSNVKLTVDMLNLKYIGFYFKVI